MAFKMIDIITVEVTIRADDLDRGGVFILPVLPGGLPAQHHDQRGVVILQGTNLREAEMELLPHNRIQNLLLSAHSTHTGVTITRAHTWQLLPGADLKIKF